MQGGQTTSLFGSTVRRAQHFGIRSVARLQRLEPLGAEGRPGLVVTGAGGAVGRVLRAGLGDAYELRGLDSTPGYGVDYAADMRYLGRVVRAFAGASAVVDLAADGRVSAPLGAVRNNIDATLNALEAARRNGVARVVFASSNHVTGGHEQDEPYASVLAGRYDGLDPERLPRLRSDAEIKPDSLYAVGKAAGEAAARHYADEHGISVICVRIGTVNLANRPKDSRQKSTLLTHRDLVHLIRCCLDAPPDLRFAIFYGVSANTWRIWDIEDAREQIGYQPMDDAASIA
jgi:NAD+ dependent glucose-6-phosphate dehydrogenase